MNFQLIVLVFIALMLSAVTYKVFTMSTIDDDVERDFKMEMHIVDKGGKNAGPDGMLSVGSLAGVYSDTGITGKIRFRPQPGADMMDAGKFGLSY
jgi:hypothetical protein